MLAAANVVGVAAGFAAVFALVCVLYALVLVDKFSNWQKRRKTKLLRLT